MQGHACSSLWKIHLSEYVYPLIADKEEPYEIED